MLFALICAAAHSRSRTPTASSGAVTEAIRDEIDYGIEATIDQDIVRYMETVPEDYRNRRG